MSSKFVFLTVLNLGILLLFDCQAVYGKGLIDNCGKSLLHADFCIKNDSECLVSNEPLQFESNGDKVHKVENDGHYKQAKTARHQLRVKLEKTVIDAGPSVLFELESYEEIKKQAREERKFIFVNFYRKNCSPCVLLDGTIASSQDLQKIISEHYILYKIDIRASRKHPLVKDLKVKSAPFLAIVSPWGHVLNVYLPSNNPKAIENILIKTVEYLDLDRLFLVSESLSNDEANVTQIVGYELLKSSFGSTVINQLYLYKDVLGPQKSWKEREKRELIFNLIPAINDQKLQFYFLDHLLEFRNIFSKMELNEKVYDLAFLGAGQVYDLNTIYGFLEDNILGEVDYYLIRSEIDYHTYVFPDTLARLNAQLDLYLDYQYEEWDDFKSIFFEMILTAQSQEDFYYLEQIALRYEPYAVDYEWLDLYALILYRSGLEQEALGLINEIKAKAFEKGVNYKPAIYNLKKD